MKPVLYWMCAPAVSVFGVWGTAAIYIDCRIGFLGLPLALVFALLFFGALYGARQRRVWWFAIAGLGLAAVSWWLSLKPSNLADWQTDVSRMPDAIVSGDRITIHNVRNCDYRTETDYGCRWETREYSFSEVRAVDLFLTDWGAPMIAHVMVSFDFGAGQHLAFSIEARKQKGQTYSATLGFFRQYGLIYLAADEHDVIRLRTNFRKGESVYLYRTKVTPSDAQRLLLQYARWMNETKSHARWYNALTENCDRSVVRYLAESRIGGITRWDWRGFLNGHGDQMLFELDDLATDGLTFSQLRSQALINDRALHLADNLDFSAGVRLGRAGFK